MSIMDTDSTREVGIITSPMNNPKASIEEVMDYNIEQARKRVETLCVQKAKLEALNMHKMPFQQIRSLLEIYPY